MEYRITNKEYRISDFVLMDFDVVSGVRLPVLDFVSTILYNNDFNGI